MSSVSSLLIRASRLNGSNFLTFLQTEFEEAIDDFLVADWDYFENQRNMVFQHNGALAGTFCSQRTRETDAIMACSFFGPYTLGLLFVGLCEGQSIGISPIAQRLPRSNSVLDRFSHQ